MTPYEKEMAPLQRSHFTEHTQKQFTSVDFRAYSRITQAPAKRRIKGHGTASTPKHQPMFNRVALTDKYAPACAAIARLTTALLELGQPPEQIASDLRQLARGELRHVVNEIVCACVRARGGRHA